MLMCTPSTYRQTCALDLVSFLTISCPSLVTAKVSLGNVTVTVRELINIAFSEIRCHAVVSRFI